MRILAVNTFISLDGVMQSPGGPDEDPTGGFTHGGWGVNYFDDEMMGQVAEADLYELLSAAGPTRSSGGALLYDEGLIADQLNGARKHVASTTLEEVEEQLHPDHRRRRRIRHIAQEPGRGRDPGSRQPGSDPDAARARPHRRVPHLDLPRGDRHRQALLR